MRIQETNIGEQILPMEKSLRNSACEIPVAPILRQLPSVYKYTNTQIHKYTNTNACLWDASSSNACSSCRDGDGDDLANGERHPIHLQAAKV